MRKTYFLFILHFHYYNYTSVPILDIHILPVFVIYNNQHFKFKLKHISTNIK